MSRFTFPYQLPKQYEGKRLPPSSLGYFTLMFFFIFLWFVSSTFFIKPLVLVNLQVGYFIYVYNKPQKRTFCRI